MLASLRALVSRSGRLAPTAAESLGVMQAASLPCRRAFAESVRRPFGSYTLPKAACVGLHTASKPRQGWVRPVQNLHQWQLWSSVRSMSASALANDDSAAESAGSATMAPRPSGGAASGNQSGSSTAGGAANSAGSSGGSSSPADSSATTLQLSSGAFVLPHPEKAAKGGEDWYFVSTANQAVGVADGVGGWADVNVDAGIYARQLMNFAKEMAEGRMAGCAAGSAKTRDPQALLESAHSRTDARGSCTACIVVLEGDRLLASNLGDSGFLLLRDLKVEFHCPQQQHAFNFPFQIGSPDSQSDSPKAAQKYELKVQPGDLIVLGTDGLWDNVYDEEIISVIKYCQGAGLKMDKTAQVLAHYARHRAADPKYPSPFAYSAFQAGLAFMGGKMDDITVVVSRVDAVSQEQQGAEGQGEGEGAQKDGEQKQGSGRSRPQVRSKL